MHGCDRLDLCAQPLTRKLRLAEARIFPALKSDSESRGVIHNPFDAAADPIRFPQSEIRNRFGSGSSWAELLWASWRRLPWSG
jgi:hypothetical protein